jgi:hypothetical protein
LFDYHISEIDPGSKFLKIIVMIVRPLLLTALTATAGNLGVGEWLGWFDGWDCVCRNLYARFTYTLLGSWSRVFYILQPHNFLLRSDKPI